MKAIRRLISRVTVLAAAVLLLAPVAAVMLDIPRQPAQALDGLADAVLWHRLGNTLLIAAGALGIALAVGLFQAWLYVRSDLPGRRTFLALAPFPLFLPPLVHVLAWFGALGVSGWPAIIGVYALSFSPLVMMMGARALRQVSRDHAETAMLFGGGRRVILHDLRTALPSAGLGCVLALVLILSDFAVADFLSAIGPKVTVYGDSLYAHHLAWRSAGAAAASLPGLALCLGLLAAGLRWQRSLGSAVDSHFEPARPVPLGRWRYPLALAALAIVSAGTVAPLGLLAWQVGSFGVLAEQAAIAWPRIRFTAGIGVAAASAATALAFVLSLRARKLRRPWLIDLLVLLPLATPALLYGIGLIRVWNRPGLDAIYTGTGILLLALLGRYLVFAWLPVSAAVEQIDPSLGEAAQLSGAGALRRAIQVHLPLSAPAIALAWTITFCFALRELDTLIMLRAGQQSLSFHLYANVIFARPEEVAAIALLLAGLTWLPLLLYMGLARRQLEFC